MNAMPLICRWAILLAFLGSALDIDAQETTRSRGLVVAPGEVPARAKPAPVPETPKPSEPERTTSPVTGSTYALIVGVRDYQDRSFTQLPNAVRDASEMRRTITSGHGVIPGQNVVLMTSDAPAPEHLPGKSAIIAVLKTWSEMVRPEDTFLFYFAGHGILEDGELYLVPMDGFLSTIEESGIPYRRIEEILAASGVSRAISLLDACHSGGGSRALSVSNSPEFFDQLERNTRHHVVFASCRAEEISHEMPETRHGAFTWHLMEGINGRADLDENSSIMLGEVVRYASDSIPAWADSKQLRQHPTRIGELTWDVMVARATAKPAPAQQDAVTERPAAAAVAATGPPPAEAATPAPVTRLAKADSVTFATVAGEWTAPWLPRMQPIAGGSFRMGTTAEDRSKTEQLIRQSATGTQISDKVLRDSWKAEALIPDTSPTIRVRSFAMSVYEITNAQYAHFVRETGHRPPMNGETPFDEGWGIDLWSGDEYPEWLPLEGDKYPILRMDHLPVINVSARDAEAYCQWLSRTTGDVYRLPTEVEWEYVAKSGHEGRLYPWGDAWRAARSNAGILMPDSSNVAGNDDDGYLFFAPVNAFEPSPWGLCNLAGNVMEWCVAQDGNGYVGRGGGWRSTPADLRTSKRFPIPDPETRSITVGFRIVRENKD